MKKIVWKIIRGSLIGLSAGVLILGLWLPGFLDGLEWKLWDLRVQLFAQFTPASDDIVLILLDQDSLDWGEEVQALPWPWPRVTVAFITDFCRRAGVKALGYDVLYSEFSSYGVEDDYIFRDALREYGNAVGAISLSNVSEGEKRWPAGYSGSLFPISFDSNEMTQEQKDDLSYTYAGFPIPELMDGFRYCANVKHDSDRDGVYREGKLISLFDNKIVPGLPLALYLAGQKKPGEIVFSANTLTINRISYPFNRKNNVILRFPNPATAYTEFSAAAVIQSELKIIEGEKPVIDPGELKDKYVLFGYSAPGLLDLRPSPVKPKGAGVHIHAVILDNLLRNNFIRDIHPGLIFMYLFFGVLLIGILGTFFSDALRSVLIYISALVLPVGLGFLCYGGGFRLPVIAPFIAFLLTLIGVSFFNFTMEGRQKRFIKNAFMQYLSPAVIEQLIADPDKLTLGGERKEISIFFSDLQGFTTISEALTPEMLTTLLNDYLSAMTDIILEEGGTVDKYEGDAIIAFWNAPISLEDHALRAVRSALRCQTVLSELRPRFKERIGKDMFMRIGLNTGIAVVGNMGSHSRFDYTMLGDAVNLAARLEGINKQFNSYTMISRGTKEKIGNAFPVRELSRVAVVGRKEPVTVYEPMLADEYEKKKEILEHFDRGLREYYAGNFVQAEKIFTSIMDKDPVSRAYAKKCRELFSFPLEEWSGVWIMTVK